MEAPHWTQIALYLLVIPAAAYWLIVHLLQLEDDGAKHIVAAVMALGSVFLAARKFG